MSERPRDTPLLVELDLTTGELVVGLGGVRYLIATGVTGPQHLYAVLGFDDTLELLGASYNVVPVVAPAAAAAAGDGGPPSTTLAESS
jgi:hypothetical protein